MTKRLDAVAVRSGQWAVGSGQGVLQSHSPQDKKGIAQFNAPQLPLKFLNTSYTEFAVTPFCEEPFLPNFIFLIFPPKN